MTTETTKDERVSVELTFHGYRQSRNDLHRLIEVWVDDTTNREWAFATRKATVRGQRPGDVYRFDADAEMSTIYPRTAEHIGRLPHGEALTAIEAESASHVAAADLSRRIRKQESALRERLGPIRDEYQRAATSAQKDGLLAAVIREITR